MTIPIAVLYTWHVTEASGEARSEGQHTVKRLAIRAARRAMHGTPHLKGEVSVPNASMLWQAHTDATGRIVVDEL
jgi:hypothetical protein